VSAPTHLAHVTLTDGTVHAVEVTGDDRPSAARAAARCFGSRVTWVSCQPLDQTARVLDALQLRTSTFPLVRGER
jgi:hypothetical protein